MIGIGVNAGIRHKQGIEMIPNVEFWKDFPFLLKVHVNISSCVYVCCVCVCVRACVCVCVRACVRACIRVCITM